MQDDEEVANRALHRLTQLLEKRPRRSGCKLLRVTPHFTILATSQINLALQRDALAEAGCGKIFIEQLSGAVADRPALRDALEFARSGDTLIVWKLDRLAR